jgi:hypothetical protein
LRGPGHPAGRARLGLLLTGAVLAAALTTAAAQPPAEISFALTSDSIITRRLSVYTEPAFLRVIELIRFLRSRRSAS